MNKQTILVLVFLTILPLSLAHMEDEDASIISQFNELQPFEHLSEGHWFAFTLSLVLWISLIYTLYSIFQWLIKKK